MQIRNLRRPSCKYTGMEIFMRKLRTTLQLLFTILTNGYLYGFLQGKIYRGKLKYACLPGLNCYSCPGALASCPIGALQALLNQRGFTVPFAALGFLFVFGSLLGRFVCGWLCPFGLVQDLMHRIPLPGQRTVAPAASAPGSRRQRTDAPVSSAPGSRRQHTDTAPDREHPSRLFAVFRKRKRLPFHHILKHGKYLTLVGLVFLGSAFLTDGFAKFPAFCKYLCPSGTLLGALPLLGANEGLRSQAGGLFFWKLGILLVLLLLSVFVYRPFCQYLCPLGAVYGLFNRFSLVQIRWEEERCIHCSACETACPVGLPVQEISRSPECIRCGECMAACPKKCLRFSGKIH